MCHLKIFLVVFFWKLQAMKTGWRQSLADTACWNTVEHKLIEAPSNGEDQSTNKVWAHNHLDTSLQLGLKAAPQLFQKPWHYLILNSFVGPK